MQINVIKVTGILAFIAIILVATLELRVQDHIGDILDWIEDHKVAGSLSFVGLYALFTVFPVPASVMSLAAGAIFKLPLGSLLVWIGAVVGEIGCFIIGRLILRDWAASLSKRYDVWQAVEAAVAEEGWKMVVLLRLSPVIPFALLNYMLSLTAISFFDYTWASALGIIPGVLAYVYIGSLANDVGEILSGRTGVSPAVTIISAIVSGIFIIAAFVVVTLYARRAINRKLEQERLMDEDFGVDVVDREDAVTERLMQQPPHQA
ncbi:g2096 [Coccomyxa elongata]